MDKLAFIIGQLNKPPFQRGITTLSEFDSLSPSELMELICDILISIDPDLEVMRRENTDGRIQRLMQFLNVMKFGLPDDQVEHFIEFLQHGDKETLHTVMHWSLHRFDHLKKRAYLAKFLMPIDIPPDFMGDNLITDLLASLKDMQDEFKGLHKNVDLARNSGTKPAEFKAEITQLEQERTQLTAKITKLKKESGDEP